MLRNDDAPFFAPYLAIAVELSKRKPNYQQASEFAKELCHMEKEQVDAFLNFKNKETSALYNALLITIQTCSAYDSDIENNLFVYEDIPLNERLSNPTFLEIRKQAAIQLLSMTNLSMYQKSGVLSAFSFISESQASKGNFGTATQLEDFRKNAFAYLTDEFYFQKNKIQIKEAAKKIIEQRKLYFLNNYITNINSINAAAEKAYEKLDEHYATLLANSVNKIQSAFKMARKKSIKKACKNFEIGIAAMVVTACVAPYLSALVAEMATVEAELAILAIDTIAYAAVSSATSAILREDFKGFHKNFLQQVAIGIGTSITTSLVAADSSGQIVKDSYDAIKVSAATSAIKNALHSILNNGKTDDALKSAILGGIAGATSEKLTAEFSKFDVGIALDSITKRSLEDGLKNSIQSSLFSLAKNANVDRSGLLLDALAAALASYIAGNVEQQVKNSITLISEANSEAKHSDLEQPTVFAPVKDSKVVGHLQFFKPQQVASNKNKQELNNESKKANKLIELENKIEIAETRAIYPMRVGLVFKKSYIEIEALFRGDLRNRGIFENGFKAWGKNTDLLSHITRSYLKDSAYISTSTSKTVAASFPPDPSIPSGTLYSYLYEIRSKRPTVNIPEQLTSMFNQGKMDLDNFEMYCAETERAFRSKISSSEIKGYWTINLTPKKSFGYEDCEYIRNIRDQFTPNPNFIPPYHFEQKIWNVGRVLGPGLTVLGATLDGMSLYHEIQQSQETGNYDNSYREGSRIVGGWTGAYVTGTLFAQIGLATCAPASAACGITFGLVGSGLGYFGGGEVATKIYDINSKSFEIVINQPERKAVYESIKEARERNNSWEPTTFVDRFFKISKELDLDSLEAERLEIDGNNAFANHMLKSHQ